MRRIYLVTYDISDPKRLRKVFKAMKGFGLHVQLSVFQCDLTSQARVELEAVLSDIIDHGKDQVMVFDLGPTAANPIKEIGVFGRPAAFHVRGAVMA